MKNTDHLIKRHFGTQWCGPTTLEHAKMTPIACYQAEVDTLQRRLARLKSRVNRE